MGNPTTLHVHTLKSSCNWHWGPWISPTIHWRCKLHWILFCFGIFDPKVCWQSIPPKMASLPPSILLQPYLNSLLHFGLQNQLHITNQNCRKSRKRWRFLRKFYGSLHCSVLLLTCLFVYFVDLSYFGRQIIESIINYMKTPNIMMYQTKYIQILTLFPAK